MLFAMAAQWLSHTTAKDKVTGSMPIHSVAF